MIAGRNSLSRWLAAPLSAALVTVAMSSAAIVPIAAASSPHGASGITRHIAKAGSTSFAGIVSSGGVDLNETPRPLGDDGSIQTDRSDSHGGGSMPVGATSQPKSVTKATPGLQGSFDGLNHFDQRFGSSDGSNAFSLEPPDQGLCVGSDGNGNTRVLEVVNDVMRVYSTSGAAVTSAVSLNAFLGYAPAFDRTNVVFGPFVTDPSCLYDAQTGHWFLDVLTLDVWPDTGDWTGSNHLDIAVSDSQDPTGSWTIYRVPVQDDGTNGTPDHHCTLYTGSAPRTNPAACLGDYPHLGSDANGIYLTTNEYSFFGNNFIGAQVYAFSKTQLASLAPNVALVQINTHGLDNNGFAMNGFTLWPSVTPGGSGDPSAAGTEYFLSSNAAAEAHDTGDGTAPFTPSTQLIVWALTDTSSLATATPSLSLSNTALTVGQYSLPPKAAQKSGNTPLVNCLNNKQCSIALNGFADPFTEKEYNLDSNDTRMQQVTWVDGHLWGALDTALMVSSAKQAGIEWFNASVSTSSGSLAASLTNSGYVGLGNDNLIYPALSITAGGTGVMAFTLVGNDYYPSAGYATVTNAGISSVHIAAAGAGPADGFSGTKLFNYPDPARPRWGDYGAAVAVGDHVWIASEYIAQTCSFATYEKTNFRCGNTRTALANWATRISEVAAP
jgi:hypothetical protein